MANNKTIKRYVPELAFQEIERCYEQFPPLFKHEKEVFYFILDLFYRLPYYNKNIKYTEDGLIRISSKYFRAYIPKYYSNYLRWLIKHNIIICDKIKKLGKAYGYLPHPNIESKVICVELPKTLKITNRIIDNYNKRQKYNRKYSEHISEMKKVFKKHLKVNLEEALLWLENQLKEKLINLNQYNTYYISLQSIHNKEFFFHVNSVNGRLDTNLTNLKSDLRQFIIGDYCHIDCNNSQPLLVNFLLDYIIINNKDYKLKNNNSIISNINTPPNPPSPSLLPSLGTDHQKILSKKLNINDLHTLQNFHINPKILAEFNDYRRSTFSLDFYDHLTQKYQITQKLISRDDIKETVYKVFFSRNWAYKDEKKIFRAMYPNVYKVLYKLKSERHNKLAICLQNIESEIFIQRISKRLVEAGIVPLTIHDSVIVLQKDRQQTLDIMSSVYFELLRDVPEFSCGKL